MNPTDRIHLAVAILDGTISDAELPPRLLRLAEAPVTTAPPIVHAEPIPLSTRGAPKPGDWLGSQEPARVHEDRVRRRGRAKADASH